LEADWCSRLLTPDTIVKEWRVSLQSEEGRLWQYVHYLGLEGDQEAMIPILPIHLPTDTDANLMLKIGHTKWFATGAYPINATP